MKTTIYDVAQAITESIDREGAEVMLPWSRVAEEVALSWARSDGAEFNETETEIAFVGWCDEREALWRIRLIAVPA